MNCTNVQESLWEYHHKQLHPSVAWQVDEHLSFCLACTDQFQQLKRVDAELDCMDEIEPSLFFDQKLEARLDDLAERHTTWRKHLFFWFHDRYAVSFVILLLTTVGAWAGFRYQQAQKLRSIQDVIAVQERYLGGSGTSPTAPTSPGTGSLDGTPSGHARVAASSMAEESIPEADLAVMENYELLQDYEFLKRFDLADLPSKNRQSY